MTNCLNCEHYGNECEGMRNPAALNHCRRADIGGDERRDEAKDNGAGMHFEDVAEAVA